MCQDFSLMADDGRELGMGSVVTGAPARQAEQSSAGSRRGITTAEPTPVIPSQTLRQTQCIELSQE